MDFLDIVMEAKKKKAQGGKDAPVDKEEQDDLPEEDSEPEDLTEETQGDETETTESEADTNSDDLPEEDSEPEDLTEEAEDDTVESETEVDPNSDDLPEEDSEPEDLTEGSDEDTAGGESTDGDTETDDSSTDTMSTETEEEQTSPRTIRLLQEDYIDLYFRTKDFVTKLTSLNKSDPILNQVVVQIDRNLNKLKDALWDYVVYDYNNNSYVANMFRYNEFIEVFKVNLEMLSAAKIFVLQKQDELETSKGKSKKS